MYTRHICVSANEMIAGISAENGALTRTLGEFAEVCESGGKSAVTVVQKDGINCFAAGPYCGFACFSDGTLVEVLPPVGRDRDFARKVLCSEFCRRCGFRFDPSYFKIDMNFMEFIISVFAGETMKIIKSGVLSAYASREENMTAVHGTIMFAENIRRNLVHRERLYVRHDVFTPDRAENRIIKSAAALFIKVTNDPRSSHLLNEALSYLDEVRMPRDIPSEFTMCINTRNTKKYSTILNICRMLFANDSGTAFSGKNVMCAQFYKMNSRK